MTLKVATTTSSGSVMGVVTLEKGLKAQGFSVTRLEGDPLKEGPLPEDFDIGLLHNTLSVSDAVMRRSVVFALQTVVNKLIEEPKLRRRVRAAPPIEFWCNTRSAAHILRGMGFEARTMYRPAPRFKAPGTFVPLPAEKRVLWYYDPPHRFMKSKLPVIKDLLEQVDDDIEVLLFPSADCPVDRPNIRALGKIDMDEWVPKVRGMVRVSDHLDYGRSTFDVLAHGRWVLYADMDEEINHSVPTAEEIPARLRALLDQEGDAEARARFARAPGFEIGALAPIWAARLRTVLDLPPADPVPAKAKPDKAKPAKVKAAPAAQAKPAKAKAKPAPAPAPASATATVPDPAATHLQTYDAGFYAAQSDNSYKSATQVVPILIEALSPKSVCDVGCGAGTWLRAWQDLGVTDLLGLEGGHVEDAFRVSPDRLLKIDLLRPDPPLAGVVGRRFDIATSLEVAEHLPEERATSFVADLCALSDTVVFGAAVPGQGGKGHLNEQWQSWWVRHFNDQGYGAQDLLRERLWAKGSVSYWYRQNTLVFRKGMPNDRDRGAYDLVHPRAWGKKVQKLEKATR